MIIRIVKMTFRPECADAFRQLFAERRNIIGSFPGCEALQLWQDTADPNIFFTYSTWRSTDDLDHYRFSDFFKDTWATVKPMFASKAEAWSVVGV